MADYLSQIEKLRRSGATESQIQEWALQNGINMNVPVIRSGGLGGTGRLAGLFSGLRNRIGPGQSLINQKLDLSSLKNLGSDLRATKLWQGGPTVAQGANTISGIYQGGKALKGLYENMNAEQDLDSLKRDINLAVSSNPMYDMYMDASDEKLLRQMKNDSLTNNWNGAMTGAVQGVPKAALSALAGGLAGGMPGAIIGGVGSLVNSGIEGYGKGTQDASAKLQGLYDRLRQADQEYRMMKRPAGLRQAGLSTQYFNQLY